MIKKVSKITNLKGEIVIPADKSVSHRAIMFSSIAKGKTIISNFSSGADCWSTLNAFRALGIEINEIDSKTIEVVSTGKLNMSFAFTSEKAGMTGLDTHSKMYMSKKLNCGKSLTFKSLVSC